MKIVIIEDDEGIIELVKMAFEIAWPEAELISVMSGKKGVNLVEEEVPDLVVLDLGLPDISGFTVLKRIRSFSSVPVIILTVTNEENSIITAFGAGADDYITKPFSSLEFIARIKSILKRAGALDEVLAPNCGPLHFGCSVQEFYKGDKYIKLTESEGRIVKLLMNNVGRIVSYRIIANNLWGAYYSSDRDKIKVYIRHLREKIEDNPRFPRLILNKSGIGYYLAPFK